MSFIAPLAGGIAHLFKKKPGTQDPASDKSIIGQQLGAMQQSKDLSGSLQSSGQNMITSAAGKGFNPVVDYWSSLLSGNRGQATSMLAPEINEIGDQYRAASASASQLLPRGGGRSSLMQELPYRQMRDQQTVTQTARPQAAQGLLQAAGGQAEVGSGLISNSINALYGATSAGRTVLDYNQRRREQNMQLGSSIGRGIFDLITKFAGGGGA